MDTVKQLAVCEASKDGCDRKQGHPGFCMKRCAKSDECLDRAGHRGRCSASAYLEWGWAR